LYYRTWAACLRCPGAARRPQGIDGLVRFGVGERGVITWAAGILSDSGRAGYGCCLVAWTSGVCGRFI